MNQVGLIINMERKAQNMSQSALSEGICSVSYLSKIENLEVNAPKDILKLLIEALGYDFSDYVPEEIFEFETSRDEIYNDYYCFNYEGVADKVNTLISKYESTNTLSVLSFDLLILKTLKQSILEMLKLEHLQSLLSLNKLLTKDQSYLLSCLYYSLMYEESPLKLDIQSEDDSLGVLTLLLSFIAYKNGEYRQALSISKKAYYKFVEDGNYLGMIQSSTISSSSYSNVGEYDNHLKEANKILKLNRVLKNPQTDLETHYNIGATYLTQREFYKAIYHLEKGYLNIHLKPGMKFYFLEKMGLAYAFSHHLEKLDTILHSLRLEINTNSLIQLLQTIAADPYYIKNPIYSSSLESILNEDESMIFGRKQMYAGLLYQAYRATYKYNKCIDLLEEYKLNQHLPFS